MGLLQKKKNSNSKSSASIDVIKLLMSFINQVFALQFRLIPTCVWKENTTYRTCYSCLFVPFVPAHFDCNLASLREECSQDELQLSD